MMDASDNAPSLSERLGEGCGSTNPCTSSTAWDLIADGPLLTRASALVEYSWEKKKGN